MAKRQATDQISKDSRPNDGDSEGEEIDVHAVASKDILAKRTIAVPRARKAPAASKPAFAGLKDASSNPFKTLQPTPNAFANLQAPQAPKAPQSTATATLQTSTKAPGTDSDKLLKLVALNASFAKQIEVAKTQSSSLDWTSLCEKYINYAKTLMSSVGAPSSLGNPKPLSPAQPAASTGFSFNKPQEQKPTENPAENPAEKLESDAAKPVFSFNKPADSKPVFAFGVSKPAETSAEKSVEKPTGTTEKPAGTTDKPVFSFGNMQNKFNGDSADKPEVEKPSDKPVFSFDKAKSSEPSGPKTGFTFTPSKDAKETKPVFSFNASTEKKESDQNDKKEDDKKENDKKETPKPLFSFGNANSLPAASSKPAGDNSTDNSTDKPVLSFNAKPPFSLNNGKSGSDKPVFSFGNPQDNKSPKFSFGSGSNPFGNSSVGSSWPAPNASAPAVPAPTAATSTSTSTSTNDNQEDQEPQEEQLTLDGPGPGEEDEDNVYEKKAKLYEFKDNKYDAIGLGNLRVLVHKTTKKTRVLVRAETSGRVLLNIAVRKEFGYKPVSKGQVKVLDVQPGETSPNVYILRVKTEEDGEQLAKALEDNKS